MLAKVWQADLAVEEYWVSEKLDGVRARWDGHKLISRGGKIFAAPAWFTAAFPAQVLDGELWGENLGYQQISSITARHAPHEGWRNIKLMVFDLPTNTGRFTKRVRLMEQLSESAHLQMISQRRVASSAELYSMLDEVINNGGEGLMLHHQDAYYAKGRSKDLLKLKPFADAEATVIGYRAGKGKYLGMVGALHVRTAEGVIFFVGSGLSDAERSDPPRIGQLITFRHQGFTDAGLPRFPVFLRIRQQ